MWRTENWENNKPQYDLLYILNPLLSTIPFSNPEHNEEKSRIKELLYEGDFQTEIKPNNTFSDIYKKTEQVGGEEDHEIHFDDELDNGLRVIYNLNTLAALIAYLRYIINDDELWLAVYTYAKNIANENELEMLINRLLSVYFEIKMVRG